MRWHPLPADIFTPDNEIGWGDSGNGADTCSPGVYLAIEVLNKTSKGEPFNCNLHGTTLDRKGGLFHDAQPCFLMLEAAFKEKKKGTISDISDEMLDDWTMRLRHVLTCTDNAYAINTISDVITQMQSARAGTRP